MQKIIIDCDPGHDDATAILYGARHLDLIGVTTVYGNQTIEKTTHNALALLTLLGLDTPVSQGCASPLNGVIRRRDFMARRVSTGQIFLIQTVRQLPHMRSTS